MKLIKREAILSGWSKDEKYRVMDQAGKSYFLRVSKSENVQAKKAQFKRWQALDQLGIPICQPLEISWDDKGVYILLSWIKGKMLKDCLPELTPLQQKDLGRQAGVYLKKIHSLNAPRDRMDWSQYYAEKMRRKIRAYEDCPIKYENGEIFLKVMDASRNLIDNRPQSYHHGDYHVGNMMVNDEGKLVIIDFDRDDYGDPFEEFNRITWTAQASPIFAEALVNGYFQDEVPDLFWKLLLLYISTNTISSLPWAIDYGPKEIQVMRDQAQEVLTWYDGMNRIVPIWYHKGSNRS